MQGILYMFKFGIFHSLYLFKRNVTLLCVSKYFLFKMLFPVDFIIISVFFLSTFKHIYIHANNIHTYAHEQYTYECVNIDCLKIFIFIFYSTLIVITSSLSPTCII